METPRKGEVVERLFRVGTVNFIAPASIKAYSAQFTLPHFIKQVQQRLENELFSGRNKAPTMTDFKVAVAFFGSKVSKK